MVNIESEASSSVIATSFPFGTVYLHGRIKYPILKISHVIDCCGFYTQLH